MNPSLLTTKFYIPPPRDRAVARAELCRRLGEGLLREGGFSRSLTLVSAPPGFGKTSLVSEWLSSLELGTAWLSLDEKDNDAARFLGYLVAALQTAEPGLAGWVLDALQVAQPPSMETLLVRLVNDLAAPGPRLVLVLDDYHVITAPEVDAILAFLVDRLPVRVHLVLATREDPALPLARYRARGQMVELRARDLVFSTREVREFFHGVMKLDLGDTDIAALEARTEGWAAGLQFAALALQNGQGPAFRSGFIASFTGSHRFVLDYLAEEVLLQQSGAVQTFLLASACLGRFCGELCDAVLDLPAGDSWEILARLDRANLFLVPLDAEGRWFRYHHLFAGLLQQRLAGARPAGCPAPALIHARASRWFDAGGLILEAFRHAAASGDMPRAEALIEDRRMPTHTRDAMMEVLAWLLALPAALKDSQPSLWVKSATFALMAGQTAGVEERLQAAESALGDQPCGPLQGQIATARSTLAVSQYRMEDAKRHARHALELLGAAPSTFRLAALWDLGVAQHNTGESDEARRAFEEVLAFSRAAGVVFFQVLATLHLGEIQENDNQLWAAAASYQQVIQDSGDHPPPFACEAWLGLARIHYQWNELETAAGHAGHALGLAHQYDRSIDRFVPCELLLARIEMARGQADAALQRLDRAELVSRESSFLPRLDDIRAERSEFLRRLGRLPTGTAAASGGPAGQPHGGVRAMVQGALALDAGGQPEDATAELAAALRLAEPGGLLRLFVDEGRPLRDLLRRLLSRGGPADYPKRILAAFPPESADPAGEGPAPKGGPAILSEREAEVLALLAAGLPNQAIADRLFVSPHTVKVHVRNIFAKLEAANRTAAVARARSLGLLA